MAFRAQIKGDFDLTEAKNVTFSVGQQLHYDTLTPNSTVSPSTISCTVMCNKETLETIWKWAIGDFTEMDGMISVMSNDGEASFATIEWEKGHCVHFDPDYLGGGGNFMPVHITIAAAKVTFCDEPVEVETGS